MKDILNDGYINGVIGRLSESAKMVQTAVSELKAAESNLQSAQEQTREQEKTGSQSTGYKTNIISTAQNRVNNAGQNVNEAKKKLDAARKEAQHALNKIEQAINANRQDEGLLGSVRSETGAAQSQLQQARQYVREDINKLQQWRKRLLQALQAAENIGASEGGYSSGGSSASYGRIYTPSMYSPPPLEDQLRYTPKLSQSYAVSPPYGLFGKPTYSLPGDRYTIKDHYGSPVGKLDNLGNYKDSTGSIVGKLDMLDASGTRLIDNAGSTIGQLDYRTGNITNLAGHQLGKMESTAPLGTRASYSLGGVMGSINNHSYGTGYGYGTYRI